MRGVQRNPRRKKKMIKKKTSRGRGGQSSECVKQEVGLGFRSVLIVRRQGLRGRKATM